MNYITEADLIRYSWFGPWAADARRCAIALIYLNNYRHARRYEWIRHMSSDCI